MMARARKVKFKFYSLIQQKKGGAEGKKLIFFPRSRDFD
jgi:hypothetical protein